MIDREAVCLGEIFVHVLGSGSGINGGDGSQGLFASMQNARDSRYLSLIGRASHVGVVEVEGRGNDQWNSCLWLRARGHNVKGFRIKGRLATNLITPKNYWK